MKKLRLPTRNIAKSGEVINWNGFSPFQLLLWLILNHSQSVSCHIAIRSGKLASPSSANKLAFGSAKADQNPYVPPRRGSRYFGEFA
jgi:hypothetical protein